MDDIKKFFIAKLPELLPCEEGIAPVIGSRALAASLPFENGKTDASQYYLSDEKTAGKNNPLISIVNKSITTVFTKRIKNTPFYVSYLSADNFVVTLLDFYCWTPCTILYRLFHIEYLTEKQPFSCCFPDRGEISEKGLFSHHGFRLAWHSDAPSVWSGDTLHISPPSTAFSSLDLVIAIAGQHVDPVTLHTANLIKIYLELERRVRSGHISHYLKTQHPAIDRMLDNAWVRVKGLSPDGKLDRPADSGSNTNDRDIWNAEIGRVLGLDMPDQTYSLLSIPVEKQGEEDGFYRMITRAYFFDDPPVESLLNGLQSWWDRYSLPVFEIKLQVLLKERADLLFMIYALAQRYRMSWPDTLLLRCCHFKDRPDLYLLALLHSLLFICTENGRVTGVYRGARQPGNLLSLKRFRYTFRYTVFSRQQFSEIRIENRQFFKIDKEVNFRFTESKNSLHIQPALLPLHAQAWQQNILEIKVNEAHLFIPLVWRKGRLDFENLRIRWLLKKNRFQFTCKAGKTVHSLEFNGEAVEVDHVRPLKKYFTVKKSTVHSGIRLLDKCGRTWHFPQRHELEKVIITGWILNQQGVFPGHVNMLEGKRQTICKINDAGRVDASILLKSRPLHLDLVIKKHRESLPLLWLEEKALTDFISFSPERNPGNLLVIVSPSLTKDLDWIRIQLEEALGFIPVLEVMTGNTRMAHPGPLLYLYEADEEFLSAAKQMKSLAIKTDRKRKDLFAEIFPDGKKWAKN